MGLAVALLGTPRLAAARPQSYSFAWTSGGLGKYVPNKAYWHNDSGSTVSTERLAKGHYQVRFYGLGDISDPFDHVQVTAYGSTLNSCQVLG
jgi:hypothetical protein